MEKITPDRNKGCKVAHEIIRLAIERERRTQRIIRDLAKQTKGAS